MPWVEMSTDNDKYYAGASNWTTVFAEEATIGFDGSYLTVEAGIVTFFAHAIGTWPGSAIVSDSLVHALAAAPPADNPVTVTCDGEQLHFGPLKVACKWQPVSSSLLAVPARREWIESLALKYTLPWGHVIAEGLRSELKAAERERSARVQQVARSLAPLGVTVGDVEALVDRRLAERFAGRSPPSY
jgi:hypothetical protein